MDNKDIVERYKEMQLEKVAVWPFPKAPEKVDEGRYGTLGRGLRSAAVDSVKLPIKASFLPIQMAGKALGYGADAVNGLYNYGNNAYNANAIKGKYPNASFGQRMNIAQANKDANKWQNYEHDMKTGLKGLPYNISETAGNIGGAIKGWGQDAATVGSSMWDKARGMFGGNQKSPVAATPVTTAPQTTAPVTQAPVTTVPADQVPVTQAPQTTAPVTQAPVTQAPVTQAPQTTAPVTQAPVTTVPASQAPAVQSPQAYSPIIQTPGLSGVVPAAPQLQVPSMQSGFADGLSSGAVSATPQQQAPAEKAQSNEPTRKERRQERRDKRQERRDNRKEVAAAPKATKSVTTTTTTKPVSGSKSTNAYYKKSYDVNKGTPSSKIEADYVAKNPGKFPAIEKSIASSKPEPKQTSSEVLATKTLPKKDNV